MQVKHLLLIAILALTAACSSTKEVVDENLSEVELYQQAQADLDNNSYTSATAKLLIRKHWRQATTSPLSCE